ALLTAGEGAVARVQAEASLTRLLVGAMTAPAVMGEDGPDVAGGVDRTIGRRGREGGQGQRRQGQQSGASHAGVTVIVRWEDAVGCFQHGHGWCRRQVPGRSFHLECGDSSPLWPFL